jgi:hypothetical protein
VAVATVEDLELGRRPHSRPRSRCRPRVGLAERGRGRPLRARGRLGRRAKRPRPRRSARGHTADRPPRASRRFLGPPFRCRAQLSLSLW